MGDGGYVGKCRCKQGQVAGDAAMAAAAAATAAGDATAVIRPRVFSITSPCVGQRAFCDTRRDTVDRRRRRRSA